MKSTSMRFTGVLEKRINNYLNARNSQLNKLGMNEIKFRSAIVEIINKGLDAIDGGK